MNAHAKMVEYYEDAYAQQAPQALADKVAQIADRVGFSQDYQVIVPKKPGVQINPINKMSSYGINAQTKNPFMLINTEWFSTLTNEQQDFVIARNFIILENSSWLSAPKLFTPLWVIIFLLLGLLAFFALKRKYMVGKPTWMVVLATLIPFLALDMALDPVHAKLNYAIARRFDAQMARAALDKMGLDKQIAIDTFEKMNQTVTKELAEGQAYWKTYETIFTDIAKRLE